MFRLIRLASMVLLGYAIYEFVQGLTGAPAAARGGGNNSGEGNRGRNARGQFTGGEGQGQLEQTEEDNGARIPHAVGRGVVGQ